MRIPLIRVATSIGLLLGAAQLVPAQVVSPPWDPVFTQPSQVADFGAAGRPFGVAAADFDGDDVVDLLVGRVTGNVALLVGNGDGTFQPAVTYGWKVAFFNAWSFTAGDVDGDGANDLIWGANAVSSGCSVSPAPIGGCGTEGSEVVTVADGDVRVLFGNDDGTFDQNPYYISGVLHNAGTQIADIGEDAGSLVAGDVDGNLLVDLVVGGVDGADSVVQLLINQGSSTFSEVSLIRQPSATGPGSPIYWPALSTQNSPWGLALGDADDDMDLDLWIGDRALYIYLYQNDGAGTFTLVDSNTAVPGRPNVYLGHDTLRAAVGYTPSLGSGDLNGDGRADVVLGLQGGAQLPDAGVAHDGELHVDASLAVGHGLSGSLGDLGSVARGVTVVDLDDDTYPDVVAAVYEGGVWVLRQLPPLDTDGDGISDYTDNAPDDPNPPRLDMNTDGSVNHQDQLDNDFDTQLGDPEDPSTWLRLGDPADPDDDNDGVPDLDDVCPFVADVAQEDRDGDGRGDACDPLDDRDPDGDGTPTGPSPGNPLYDLSVAAKTLWAQGDTHFVLRIDALSRFFQNEFTQIMTDAAVLDEADWAVKCWENYEFGDIPGDALYEPCGTDEGTASQTLTLEGGRQVPISLVVIPKQLWTDPPVVDWINDRNDSPLLEIGQHGTYHANNVPVSDWQGDPTLDFYACEMCGLNLAENFELMKVGYDTMLGDYTNRWVAESGATAASPKIDWTTSANPMISFAPPFNASDTAARDAVARLGFLSYSASVFEENSPDFTPEGSHHEAFDDFGMFHASADRQIDPPEIVGGTYSPAAYEAFLQSNVQDGGLNTWLIEEVEWGGRACNDLPRLVDCFGSPNREDNTVYAPRWEAWLQLLDFVDQYPGGVVMTLGEVALANALDNCPADANPDQLDLDADGLGDVCDGDDDGDGADDTIDCAPLDGGVFAMPGTVADVGFGLDRDRLLWGSLAGAAGTATVYDVVRGAPADWPVGPGSLATCLATDVAGASLLDDETPPSGSLWWYLVRGTNACGVGSWGSSSNGTSRDTLTACPSP